MGRTRRAAILISRRAETSTLAPAAHYTTAPPALGDWRNRQVAAIGGQGARPDPAPLRISDDELRGPLTALAQHGAGPAAECRMMMSDVLLLAVPDARGTRCICRRRSTMEGSSNSVPCPPWANTTTTFVPASA